MTIRKKPVIVAGALVLGLLAIPVARRFFADATGPQMRDGVTAGTSPWQDEAEAGKLRRRSAVEWKLPFRLKARLTPEQAAILAEGRVGAYLREHPAEDDLLVSWAAVDPDAASAWLASVGEIKLDGVGYYLSHLTALAAGVFAHGGFEEMQALLEKHANDPLLPPKYQGGGFASHPWYKMAREDTAQEAIAYLKEHPEENGFAGVFLSGIEDTDRMLAALDYFHAKGIACSPDYWQFRSRVEEDGALLADWSAGSRPELLEEILIGWSASNPEDARKWVDAHASQPDLAPVLGEVRKVMDGPGE